MDCTSIQEALGLPSFPDYLKGYYGKVYPVSLCTEETIRDIEERYSVFGRYTEKIIECLKFVKENEALTNYINATLGYINEVDIPHAKLVTHPSFPEVECMAYYRGLVLASLMPSAIESYRARGFSEGEIKAT